MSIEKFRIRKTPEGENIVKQEQVIDPVAAPRPKIIDFKVERLKKTNPELFDPVLFHNREPWDLAEYRKRRELLAQADAVLAVAVGSGLSFEERIRFMASMHDITLIERKPRGRSKLVK